MLSTTAALRIAATTAVVIFAGIAEASVAAAWVAHHPGNVATHRAMEVPRRTAARERRERKLAAERRRARTGSRGA